MSKFNVGDKVRYTGNDHDYMPEYYPKIGTVGIIEEIKTPNAWVQWPNGSTSKSDCWCCSLFDIEKIIENMTNEEIWEMLKPKFNKNNLEGLYFRIDRYGYVKEDVHNAIAIAYRSGYERAMKGRPFKIGEKKKKGGHWEPINPKNLPKEGTRVRYSRECKDYKNCESEIVIGDTGIVRFEGLEHEWFGMKPDNPRNLYYNWLSFEGTTAGCLDMWVEDDE